MKLVVGGDLSSGGFRRGLCEGVTFELRSGG